PDVAPFACAWLGKKSGPYAALACCRAGPSDHGRHAAHVSPLQRASCIMTARWKLQIFSANAGEEKKKDTNDLLQRKPCRTTPVPCRPAGQPYCGRPHGGSSIPWHAAPVRACQKGECGRGRRNRRETAPLPHW